MLYMDTELRESKISGLGLFTLVSVRKGSVVANFGHDCELISEKGYQEEQKKGNELLIKSGVRWVGKNFLYNNQIGNEEYINHSNQPTLLCHCGVCFATKDLEPGDELTIDYRYLLAEKDINAFEDEASGQFIDGLPPKEALLNTAQQLLKLVLEVSSVE